MAVPTLPDLVALVTRLSESLTTDDDEHHLATLRSYRQVRQQCEQSNASHILKEHLNERAIETVRKCAHRHIHKMDRQATACANNLRTSNWKLGVEDVLYYFGTQGIHSQRLLRELYAFSQELPSFPTAYGHLRTAFDGRRNGRARPRKIPLNEDEAGWKPSDVKEARILWRPQVPSTPVEQRPQKRQRIASMGELAMDGTAEANIPVSHHVDTGAAQLVGTDEDGPMLVRPPCNDDKIAVGLDEDCPDHTPPSGGSDDDDDDCYYGSEPSPEMGRNAQAENPAYSPLTPFSIRAGDAKIDDSLDTRDITVPPINELPPRPSPGSPLLKDPDFSGDGSARPSAKGLTAVMSDAASSDTTPHDVLSYSAASPPLKKPSIRAGPPAHFPSNPQTSRAKRKLVDLLDADPADYRRQDAGSASSPHQESCNDHPGEDSPGGRRQDQEEDDQHDVEQHSSDQHDGDTGGDQQIQHGLTRETKQSNKQQLDDEQAQRGEETQIQRGGDHHSGDPRLPQSSAERNTSQAQTGSGQQAPGQPQVSAQQIQQTNDKASLGCRQEVRKRAGELPDRSDGDQARPGGSQQESNQEIQQRGGRQIEQRNDEAQPGGHRQVRHNTEELQDKDLLNEVRSESLRRLLQSDEMVNGDGISSVLQAMYLSQRNPTWFPLDPVVVRGDGGPLTKPGEIRDHHKIIVAPIHLSDKQHWTLAIIDRINHTIQVFDPLSHDHLLERTFEAAATFAVACLGSTEPQSPFITWKRIDWKVWKQDDGTSCGIYVLAHAIHSVIPQSEIVAGTIRTNLWRRYFAILYQRHHATGTSAVLQPFPGILLRSYGKTPQQRDVASLFAHLRTLHNVDVSISHLQQEVGRIERIFIQAASSGRALEDEATELANVHRHMAEFAANPLTRKADNPQWLAYTDQVAKQAAQHARKKGRSVKAAQDCAHVAEQCAQDLITLQDLKADTWRRKEEAAAWLRKIKAECDMHLETFGNPIA